MAPLYLIDASIYIFQAHFSPHTQVWSKRAQDRSAFVGFVRFLLRFLQTTQAREAAPLAVAFDESLQCGFRHRLYPEYKSNRVLPDENLARQLKACAELCDALGVRGFGSREYEADDIIGTLSAQRAPRSVVIVSRDKDLSQLLLQPQDELWDFYGGTRRNRAAIQEQMGIWPEQFPCYVGLTGDSIDCIPGVPGVGPVAARRLLQHFGSLDEMFERVGEVDSLGFRGARRCAGLLGEHQALARLSRQLAVIVKDAPDSELFASVTDEELAWNPREEAPLKALLQEMELNNDDVQRILYQLDTLNRIIRKRPS